MAQPAPPPVSDRLALVDRALQARRIDEARSAAAALTAEYPALLEGWIRLARAEQMAARFAAMRAALEAALTRDPASPLARLMLAECDIHEGQLAAARARLEAMRPDAAGDAAWLARLSEAYTQCGDHQPALTLIREAAALQPQNPGLRYALASALVAQGDLASAETEYDTVLKLQPQDTEAAYSRSMLRRQTPARNHVAELRQKLPLPGLAPMQRVQLGYALSKELEDLGDARESWNTLSRAAAERRAMMRYDVSGDVAAMQKIAQVFSPDWLSSTRGLGADAEGPVFILGLPRSGSTLTDRILSAHPDVESLGELNDLPLALNALCGPGHEKLTLIEAAAALDPAQLGTAYLKRTQQRRQVARFFIDKAPANFLYIGLIAAALPQARIVHIHRDRMDNAYSLYKALFRMGYPYSYDFADLSAYIRAHEALMAHWRGLLPGRLIDVKYEDIVSDQEAETRRLLTEIGLGFDPACLSFHRNASPSATHSAAQVRQPIYASSVGLWRRYEAQLMPLKHMLETGP